MLPWVSCSSSSSADARWPAAPRVVPQSECPARVRHMLQSQVAISCPSKLFLSHSVLRGRARCSSGGPSRTRTAVWARPPPAAAPSWAASPWGAPTHGQKRAQCSAAFRPLPCLCCCITSLNVAASWAQNDSNNPRCAPLLHLLAAQIKDGAAADGLPSLSIQPR